MILRSLFGSGDSLDAIPIPSNGDDTDAGANVDVDDDMSSDDDSDDDDDGDEDDNADRFPNFRSL